MTVQRKTLSIIVPVVLLGLVAVVGCRLRASAAFGGDEAKRSPEHEAVTRVIEDCYFNGAFNRLDADSMTKGFHEDFAIFSAKGEKLARYEIADWIKGVRRRKAKPDFDPKSANMDCRVVALNITGGAAAAKVEIRGQGRLVYTDYLSLLKFKSGWRIAAKVYHQHPNAD